jgi:hypothetical protein
MGSQSEMYSLFILVVLLDPRLNFGALPLPPPLLSLSLSLSLRFVWKDELNLFISSTRERTKF